MRLTIALFFGRKPHGFKYRGKHRVVKPVTPAQLFNLRRDYERTEKNMLFLRHPYLTVEQSRGHMAEARKKYYENAICQHVEVRNAKFEKHVTLAERLAHLKVSEAWD